MLKSAGYSINLLLEKPFQGNVENKLAC